MQRVSPAMVVHTGGQRLAATGDMAFLQRYAARRTALAGGPATPVEVDLTLADDHYGIVYMRTRSGLGDRFWDRRGMGAWRFEGDLAVEHWELSDGKAMDEFYLAADPALDGDAAR